MSRMSRCDLNSAVLSHASEYYSMSLVMIVYITLPLIRRVRYRHSFVMG